MNLEDNETQHSDKMLWTLKPELREWSGTCAANLQLTGVIERTDQQSIETAIQNFVKNGGGFVGICAGAYCGK